MNPPLDGEGINWGEVVLSTCEQLAEMRPKVERIPQIEAAQVRLREQLADTTDAIRGDITGQNALISTYVLAKQSRGIWPYATATNGLLWVISTIILIFKL